MNTQEYTDLGVAEAAVSSSIDRRAFLKRLGGGVIVLFAPGAAVSAVLDGDGPVADVPAFNAYLRIGEDGRVSCLTGKIEMGQGVVTSLPQMLADELDVALDDVDIVMGDTDLCPFDQGTWGSLSTRVFGPQLRAAAAEARAVLLDLAAEHLSVPVGRLQVEEGVVFDESNTDHRVSYAALTEGKQITREVTEKPTVKDVSAFRVMGKSFNRRDAREKVTGQAKYAADVRFQDMLYARIVRPPAHGATLRNLDTSAAEAIEGVRIVQDEDLVAVLHRYRDVADNALRRVKADFEMPPATPDEKSIYDHLLKVAPEGRAAVAEGDLAQGEQAGEVIEATYLNAYVAHAPMEPHAAVAKMDDGRMTVWASTQNPFGVRTELALKLGMPADQIRVITPFVGGGFGGKSANQQAVEAARLAKAAGQPVQVAWSREEEFFYDTYRPAAVVKIRSAVTGAGRMSSWDYHVYFAGQRGSDQYYDIPHYRTMVYNTSWRGGPESHPFATGAWRAPGANTNTFARESQIDMMATRAGVDPLEFRLAHLKEKKVRGVLQAAADRFGYTPAKGPSGRGYGIACGIDAGTWVAAIAEVEVDKRTGQVQVKRVVCAQDMGLVVNPAGAVLQVEGCITMGLGYALSEELHFKGGEILDLNFDRYELPRFSWVPEIETVLIDSEDPEPHGGGEPAIILMGGLIANAIFDATGARLFELPMTPARVLAGM